MGKIRKGPQGCRELKLFGSGGLFEILFPKLFRILEGIFFRAPPQIYTIRIRTGEAEGRAKGNGV